MQDLDQSRLGYKPAYLNPILAAVDPDWHCLTNRFTLRRAIVAWELQHIPNCH